MMVKRLLERRNPNPDTLDVNLRKVARKEFVKIIHRCEPMITKDSPEAEVVLRVMVKGLCVREENK